jgi:hypothetical protein
VRGSGRELTASRFVIGRNQQQARKKTIVYIAKEKALYDFQ